MARISETDEAVTNLDWFAVDSSGAIGHFTTSGVGAIPESVQESLERCQLLDDFFRQNLQPRCRAIYDERIFVHVRLPSQSEVARQDYLSGFLEMGERGLFSF